MSPTACVIPVVFASDAAFDSTVRSRTNSWSNFQSTGRPIIPASRVNASVDNSDNFAAGSFDRIGYHVQLDDEWVFASINTWTSKADLLGVPVDVEIGSEYVGRLNIVSNAAALKNLTGTSHMTADLEFWSNCYGSIDGSYDSNDAASTDDCYGSWQVHTEDGTTVFAFNAWSHSSTTRISDLGIGDYTGSTRSEEHTSELQSHV